MFSAKIETDPEVCNGKAVACGTRIAVETILGCLSVGDDVPDFIAGHPNLTPPDILACHDDARRVGAARSVTLAAALILNAWHDAFFVGVRKNI